jgi:hypothetical protein
VLRCPLFYASQEPFALFPVSTKFYKITVDT